jgi:hypothetical protein
MRVPHQRRSRRNFYWIIVAIAIFLGYALNFLYFFVDDEGIALVYAQNLLRGRGLIYSALEGPVESYSNFLQVWLDALFLGATHLIGWPKLAVFFVGKAAALAAAAACIAVTYLTMRRLPGVTDSGAVSGLAVLALSGPLALWSCSSMETASFALLVSLLTFALVAGTYTPQPHPFDRLAAVAAVLVGLDRIDGLLFSAALIGAFAMFADHSRRKALAVRVMVPAIAVLALYHGWRLWYFGNVLNLPLYAKVLYKLRPQGRLLIKAPPLPYGLRFVQLYGWTAILAVAAAVAVAVRRHRPLRPPVLACAILATYVCVVGDWMFGLRFFVALMPLIAIVASLAISVLFGTRRMLGWIVALAIVAWAAVSARAFERQYESATSAVSWLRQPTFDAGRFFGSYYGLLEVAQAHIGAGQKVAYNQAGFLPFMLNLENIDNLGICSRFYARLPAQDLFFTEVGHYAPLTAHASIGAEEAYLLDQDVPFVIQRGDLLRGANDGHVPAELMGGYYRILARDPFDNDVIYQRTARDASAYKTNPHLFFENLAHTAYVQRAVVNQRVVAPDDIAAAFPFLRESTGSVMAAESFEIDLQFALKDMQVSELDINDIRAHHHAAAVSLELLSAAGVAQYHLAFALSTGEARGVFERLPAPVKASRLVLRITTAPGERTRVSISDMRVQGQSPVLARYIRKTLRF